MKAFEVQAAANGHLDDIFDYTAERWGVSQAIRYIDDLFEQFDAIARRQVPWRAAPAALGIGGYRRHHRRHYIYWKIEPDGTVAVVAILHDRMEQAQHL